MEPSEEAIEQTLEKWRQAMEAMRPALEALREAIQQAWEAVCEALRPFVTALLEWWEEVRREELYRRLRRRRFPHQLARFLARRCPERWLPGL